jgi:hypothetical protein
MGADLALIRSDCECCYIELGSITYNLSPMLREAGMPPWATFDGLTASEASHIWRNVREKLLGDPDHYKTLNPPNGWGTYDGLVAQLDIMIEQCIRHPRLTVSAGL